MHPDPQHPGLRRVEPPKWLRHCYDDEIFVVQALVDHLNFWRSYLNALHQRLGDPAVLTNTRELERVGAAYLRGMKAEWSVMDKLVAVDPRPYAPKAIIPRLSRPEPVPRPKPSDTILLTPWIFDDELIERAKKIEVWAPPGQDPNDDFRRRDARVAAAIPKIRSGEYPDVYTDYRKKQGLPPDPKWLRKLYPERYADEDAAAAQSVSAQGDACAAPADQSSAAPAQSSAAPATAGAQVGVMTTREEADAVVSASAGTTEDLPPAPSINGGSEGQPHETPAISTSPCRELGQGARSAAPADPRSAPGRQEASLPHLRE